MQKVLAGIGVADGVGLVAGLVMSLSATDGRSKWAALPASVNGNRYFIDTSSLSTVGSYRTAWIKFLPKDPQTFQYATSLMYFDCDKRTAAMKSFIQYSSTDVLLEGTFPDSDLVFAPLAPDTTGDAERQSACT